MIKLQNKRCDGRTWHLFEKTNKVEIENNSMNLLTNARR